jgi:alanine racemase
MIGGISINSIDSYMQTRAEIDLDMITHNSSIVRSCLDEKCKVMAVVKADAYGHGAPMVAKRLEENDTDMFAVSMLDEAIQLRTHGIKRPILIFGPTFENEFSSLIEYDLTQAVYSFDYAKKLSDFAASRKTQIPIHLKIDTGMSRVGWYCQTIQRLSETVSEIEKVAFLPGIIPEGIYTHFAMSEDCSSEFTALQFDRFQKLLCALAQRQIHFSLRHCLNSGGIINYPEMQLDMVRVGILLYGSRPEGTLRRKLDVRPVMHLKTSLVQIKTIEQGHSVSYGRKYIADSEVRVGTIPIGYADGLSRKLSNRGKVLVGGALAPMIGRICMDQTMIDLTGLPAVKERDTVTLFGCDENCSFPVEIMAHQLGTITYEVLCAVGKRVPRIYFSGGKRISSPQDIHPLLNYS